MPKDLQKHPNPRQRPVSCQFCRTRKLRCSRTAPCSNCVSRRITCDLQDPIAQPRGTSGPSQNLEIIERLHRLESLLVARKGDEQGPNCQPPAIQESQPQLIYPSAAPSPTGKVDRDRNISWPGNASAAKTPSAKISRDRIVFRICPARQVTEAQTYIQDGCHPSENSEPKRCIWLPPPVEAQILLAKFIRVAHQLPYVTHIPSLLSVLEQAYVGLSEKNQIQSGHAILLLSIFSAATISWVQSDCAYGVYSASADANEQGPLWLKAAEDVLDMARRSPSPMLSIEGVQGVIIVGFIAAHLDGLARYRMLFAVSVVLARDLGLHRIDHPSNLGAATTSQAEIGRRVWWYLCASDWAMAARASGLSEGIYSCHPRQMITKKPLNVNDEEIIDGMSRDERPLSQPTTMSYTLQRIRLAEIARSIVDRSPLAMAYTSSLSHDAAMDIDTELQTLINDVPVFYSMSESALVEAYALTPTQAEKTVFQGKMVYFLLYSQRCRLHLPYFARSSENATYAPSREICTKHASYILHSELWQEDPNKGTVTTLNLTELLIGVFMACIVLLMDVTLNPLSPQYLQQREEVCKAFKIIEEAKNGSEASAKFVNSLVHVLRKNNLNPPRSIPSHLEPPMEGSGVGTVSQGSPQKETLLGGLEGSGYEQYSEVVSTGSYLGQFEPFRDADLTMASEGSPIDVEDDLSSYWAGFTRSFEQGTDTSNFDWDSIFLELDSSFI
ncbi:hypothetical protein GQ53DRAFT_835202 [Thozetella sp. PMI_491]|nr:hypothetical protein GQ53DRAFT_835202 [Thozetella sp. PMI_491]